MIGGQSDRRGGLLMKQEEGGHLLDDAGLEQHAVATRQLLA